MDDSNDQISHKKKSGISKNNYLTQEQVWFEKISWALQRQLTVTTLILAGIIGIFEILSINQINSSIIVTYFAITLFSFLFFIKFITYTHTIANCRLYILRSRVQAGFGKPWHEVGTSHERINNFLNFNFIWFLKAPKGDNDDFAINWEKTLFVGMIIVFIFFWILWEVRYYKIQIFIDEIIKKLQTGY